MKYRERTNMLPKENETPVDFAIQAGKGIMFSVNLALALLRQISRIPGSIRFLKEHTEEFENNKNSRNEDFLEDIEKGRFALAQIRGGLFGFDINFTGKEHGKNALLFSVSGNDKLLKGFILANQSDFSKPRLDFSKTDFQGTNVLIQAVKSGNIENVEFVLGYPELLFKVISDKYFSGENKELLTPLVEKKIREEIEKTYIINTKHKDKFGNTALDYALEIKNPQIIGLIGEVSKYDKWQMKELLNVTTDKKEGFLTQLINMIRRKISNEIVNNISSNSEFWEKQVEKTGETSQILLSIYHTYRDRNEIFLRSFKRNTLEKNALVGMVDMNYCSNVDGKNALMIAVESNKQDKLDWVLAHSKIGTDELNIHIQDKDGNTPLMTAATNGNYYAAEKIIDYKLLALKALQNKFSSFSDIDRLFYPNDLMIARKNFMSLINMKNNMGKTAIMLAAENGNYRIIDLIMKKGYENRVRINLEAQDMSGYNLLGIAIKNNNFKAASTILSNAASRSFTNKKNGNGKTAMEIAIENNNIHMIYLLLEHKARTDIKTDDGKNMMDLAIEKNCSQKVRKLLKREGVIASQMKLPQESPILSNILKKTSNYSIEYGFEQYN